MIYSFVLICLLASHLRLLVFIKIVADFQLVRVHFANERQGFGSPVIVKSKVKENSHLLAPMGVRQYYIYLMAL